VFGAQVNLAGLAADLRGIFKSEPMFQEDICVALLDDSGRPLALSHPNFVPETASAGREFSSSAGTVVNCPGRNSIPPRSWRRVRIQATRKTMQVPLNWKRAFVASEIGEVLPHWEVRCLFVEPAQAGQAAATARLTVGLLVALLVLWPSRNRGQLAHRC